jgi:ATP-dependent exoDNAse (exonuclease V) beta subunit
MNFNHVKLSELDFELESVTTETGRTYKTPSGKSYPSITTVLSSYNKKAIYEWRQKVGEQEANRISKAASGRGTKLHNVVEKYLLNEMSELKMQTMMPDTKELFLKVKPFLDNHIGDIYGIEQALYSDRLQIAGRCDCIAEWEGELSIVDWKTSTRVKERNYIQNYFMQCSAYAEMFEEITGKPINQIVVAIAVEDSNVPSIFVENKADYLLPLKQYISKYNGAL